MTEVVWPFCPGFQQQHLVLTVKHGGGGVIISSRFIATEPGHLATTESTKSSPEHERQTLYKCFLEGNVRVICPTTKVGQKLGHASGR